MKFSIAIVLLLIIILIACNILKKDKYNPNLPTNSTSSTCKLKTEKDQCLREFKHIFEENKTTYKAITSAIITLNKEKKTVIKKVISIDIVSVDHKVNIDKQSIQYTLTPNIGSPKEKISISLHFVSEKGNAEQSSSITKDFDIIANQIQ